MFVVGIDVVLVGMFPPKTCVILISSFFFFFPESLFWNAIMSNFKWYGLLCNSLVFKM